MLRVKRVSDAISDYAWRCDAELARLDAALPLTMSFADFMASYELELMPQGQRRRRFAIDTLDGRHIGNCGYYDIDDSQRQAELGILIGDRVYWDAGYGADAISTLVGYILKETKLERIYLHTLDWNTRAQRCFEKCGFVPCGYVAREGNNFVVMELRREWIEASDNQTGEQQVPDQS